MVAYAISMTSGENRGKNAKAIRNTSSNKDHSNASSYSKTSFIEENYNDLTQIFTARQK